MKVDVRVWIRGSWVSLSRVSDKKIVAAFSGLANDLGKKLDSVKCPEHGQGPTDVRVEVGSNGAADIRYESCCPKLKELVGKAL